MLEIKIIKNTGSAISAGTVYVDVRLHVHAHVDAYVFAYIYIHIFVFAYVYILTVLYMFAIQCEDFSFIEFEFIRFMPLASTRGCGSNWQS